MSFPLRSILQALPSAAVLGLAACLSPHGVRMQDIDPLGWQADDPATVAYENTDTVSRREIRTVVRLQRDFVYDRLGLEVVTITPNGLRWRDTVNVPAHGRRHDLNRYTEIEHPYRRRVVLNQPGRYLFLLSPVIPGPPIKGIASAGIHIVPE